MPTDFTHAIIGFGASRLPAQRREGGRLFAWTAVLLPVVPDLDSHFMRWIPYEHTFGHRGFSHSLVFALLLAAAAALVCRRCRTWFPGGMWGMGALFFALGVSHGLLDAMTDGGLGVAFFSPFSNDRYFLPWTPIPVSPFGIVTADQRMQFLSAFSVEVLLFWPLALALPVYRSGLQRPFNVVVACLMVAVSAVGWISRI